MFSFREDASTSSSPSVRHPLSYHSSYEWISVSFPKYCVLGPGRIKRKLPIFVCVCKIFRSSYVTSARRVSGWSLPRLAGQGNILKSGKNVRTKNTSGAIPQYSPLLSTRQKSHNKVFGLTELFTRHTTYRSPTKHLCSSIGCSILHSEIKSKGPKEDSPFL